MCTQFNRIVNPIIGCCSSQVVKSSISVIGWTGRLDDQMRESTSHFCVSWHALALCHCVNRTLNGAAVRTQRHGLRNGFIGSQHICDGPFNDSVTLRQRPYRERYAVDSITVIVLQQRRGKMRVIRWDIQLNNINALHVTAIAKLSCGRNEGFTGY